MGNSPLPRVLVVTLIGLVAVMAIILVVGVMAAEGKNGYELTRELLVPLVSPLVAMIIPFVLFFVIPAGQNRERFALDLCAQYQAEEMRHARNVAWEHFVTAQRNLPPMRRAERLKHFVDYLTDPEAHRAIDSRQDEVYQRTTRVLEFFALVNDCVGRGLADAGIVRSFLLYYYLWWRDEIMEPLRKTRQIVSDHPKFKPDWWEPLSHLDRLAAAPHAERPATPAA